MSVAVPPDALALLRECQDRALEREGIPMVLAVVSEIGDLPPAPDTVEDGNRLAETMDSMWTALAPTGRNGDMGQVINVLQATSFADFGGTGGRL